MPRRRSPPTIPKPSRRSPSRPRSRSRSTAGQRDSALRFQKGFTRLRGEVIPTPPALHKLPRNKGIEALVMVPKGMPLAGTLIAFSERGLDTDGNLIAFLIGGKTPGQFSVN